MLLKSGEIALGTVQTLVIDEFWDFCPENSLKIGHFKFDWISSLFLIPTWRRKKSKQTVKSVKLINFAGILADFKPENVANDSWGGLASISRPIGDRNQMIA